MYCKGKWCTAGGKDPLFGRVDGFQIDPKIFLMLIDLTQHATRCSDSSGQAQEYLIARHAAVETETVLVQICLELGAPSVICSLKECFQITDK